MSQISLKLLPSLSPRNLKMPSFSHRNMKFFDIEEDISLQISLYLCLPQKFSKFSTYATLNIKNTSHVSVIISTALFPMVYSSCIYNNKSFSIHSAKKL